MYVASSSSLSCCKLSLLGGGKFQKQKRKLSFCTLLTCRLRLRLRLNENTKKLTKLTSNLIFLAKSNILTTKLTKCRESRDRTHETKIFKSKATKNVHFSIAFTAVTLLHLIFVRELFGYIYAILWQIPFIVFSPFSLKLLGNLPIIVLVHHKRLCKSKRDLKLFRAL